MPAGTFYKYKPKRKYKRSKNTKSKLTSLQRKVAMIMPEVKELYTDRAFGSTTDGDSFTPINVMQRGTENGERIGVKIRLKSLSLNLVANF